MMAARSTAGKALALDAGGQQFAPRVSVKLDSVPYTVSFSYSDKDSHESTSLQRNWRWIPNTGEYLLLGKVSITIANKAGNAMKLYSELKNKSYSIVLGALDRGYTADAAKSALGNVYNNKGSGFEIGAMKSQATFNSESVTAKLTLTKGANGSYTSTFSKPSSGMSYYYLKPDDNGTLSLVEESVHSGAEISRQDEFGIRPIAGQAYAGDDIVLTASISIWSQLPGGKLVKEMANVKNDETKYLAVYDKKMLWRANLYIDERTSEDDRVHDWNDLYPWNAPSGTGIAGPAWWDASWGYNNWNKPDGNGKVPGGQVISIKPWTRFTDGSTISGKVAYGWGLMDSPFKFNDAMLSQANYIRSGRDDSPGNAALYLGVGFKALAWNEEQRETIAPGNNWYNYVFPQRNLKVQAPGNAYWKYGTFTEDNMKTASQAYNNTDDFVEKKQHTYRLPSPNLKVPGLSTWLDSGSDGNNTFNGINTLTQASSNYNADSNQITYSTGVDCSGFIVSAVAYLGDPYPNLGTDKIGTSSFISENISHMLQEKSGDPDPELNNLKYVVPGDILVWPGKHIVIVQGVNPAPNGVVNKRGQLSIIQAGPGPAWGKFSVYSGCFWDGQAGLIDKKEYQVRRLSTTE
jgi:hypothetical protein